MSDDALLQLGMGLDAPEAAQRKGTDHRSTKSPEKSAEAQTAEDFFIVRNGLRCAGSHLIIDIYGASHLDDLEHVERTLKACVDAAGATLLHIHLHPFEPNGGISGVAVLAESHISIHSWPERDYAALDIFMCGNTEPERCIDVLGSAFEADRMTVKELLRGKEA